MQEETEISELEALSKLTHYKLLQFILDTLDDIERIEKHLDTEEMEPDERGDLEAVKEGFLQNLQKLRMAGIYETDR